MKSNNSFTISPFHIRLCSCSHSQSSILHSFFHSDGFRFDDGEGKENQRFNVMGRGDERIFKRKGRRHFRHHHLANFYVYETEFIESDAQENERE